MDPVTLFTLARGAKWAWDQYQQTAVRNPGHSVDELRVRLDASEELIRNNFALIEALESHARETDTQLAAQRARILRLERRLRLAVGVGLLLAVALAGWMAATRGGMPPAATGVFSATSGKPTIASAAVHAASLA